MSAATDYVLHLADNALVLGQRNAEWCGHGPILEEDIALSNVSLDLIGQARLLYQLVATLKGGDCTEDKLAYFRDVGEFRNYTLLELPHHGPLSGYAHSSLDYATTIVRNFLYSALSNVSLDLIGQARLLYQLAATLKGGDCTEDKLAYFRDIGEFRNYTLLELPHHGPLSGYAHSSLDYATTIVRNFLYSALMALLWEALEKSANSDLAAIAAKSLKEVRYHLRHSRDWLIRLGDGTDESHARVQAALDHLFPYTEEFWAGSPAELAAVDAGIGVDLPSLKADWDGIVEAALEEATLQRPAIGGYVPEGKNGIHSEHLGFLLAEMQSLARAHPNGVW